MFGELGRDRIITEGGDWVEGGSGNDRIESGDLNFRLVDGGAGFDTWVLPLGNKILDLSAVVASNRLKGIEGIELRGSQEIVIRAADVGGISGGATTLRISGTATDKVDLLGVWTEGATQAIDGNIYRTFTSGGSTVLVQSGSTVLTGGSAPVGAAGLDAIAGGTAAPVPGEINGADYTPTTFFAQGYELAYTITVDAEETWYTDIGGAVFTGETSNNTNLINHGLIHASGGMGATAAYLVYTTQLRNYGVMEAFSTGDWRATGMVSGSFTLLWNEGRIEVQSEAGLALGAEIWASDSPWSDDNPFYNSGNILVTSTAGAAVGVRMINGGENLNSGLIQVHGATSALGMSIGGHGSNIPQLVNSGSILVTASNGVATGLFLDASSSKLIYNTAGGVISGDVAIEARFMNHAWLEFHNSGVVHGDIVFSLFQPDNHWEVGDSLIANYGTIEGRLLLSWGADVVDNRGSIVGDVSLGGGADYYSGSAGTHSGVIDGGEGDDVLVGGGQREVMIGGLGDDQLDGGAGDDDLSGGDGSDRLYGGKGADQLNGGAGNDSFIFSKGDGNDVITGFTAGGADDVLRISGFTSYTLLQIGTDLRVIFDASNSILLKGITQANFTAADIVFSSPFSIDGTAYSELLHGTSGADTINGLFGADIIWGEDGDDLLYGGEHDDVLRGGAGDDVLNGGGGSDSADYSTFLIDITVSLANPSAQDTGGGLDTLVSIENLIGGEGDDHLTGDVRDNTLNGGAGDDWLSGGAGDDILFGGAGVDVFYFDGSSPSGWGVDAIWDYQAQDVIYIVGYSSYWIRDSSLLVDDGAGNYSIIGLVNYSNVPFNEANIILVSSLTPVTGTPSSELLMGAAASDQLDGLAGSDVLVGMAGNDTLNGGDGDDVLIGGAQRDAFFGGAGFDTVDYSDAAVGITVYLGSITTVNNLGSPYEVMSSIEAVVGSGFNDNFNGSVGNDTFIGGAGIDMLVGGDGNDTLRGGADHDDRLVGGRGDDTFVIWAGDGYDYITDFTAGGTEDSIKAYGFSTYQLVQEFSNVQVIFDNGAARITLWNVSVANMTAADVQLMGAIPTNTVNGSGSADSLNGGVGIDKLNGLGGNDTLVGFADNDVLTGGDGNDVLRGGGGNDTLDGGAGVDTASYMDMQGGVNVDLNAVGAQSTGGAGLDTLIGIENLTGSGGHDSLAGDAAANTLTGGEGNDTLLGNGGADILIGGAGSDTLDGGAGHDIFQFAIGDGVDTITGFNAGGSEDTIQVAGFTTYALVQEGSSLRVVFDGLNSLLLLNVTLASFTASDINIALGPLVIGGTSGTDTLLGTAAIDQMTGLAGADVLTGMDSNDSLDGGEGDDVLTGGTGNDSLIGGAGADIADYSTATAAVTVSLAIAAAQNTGSAGTDTVTGMEGLRGSVFNDTLTGDAGANTLEGLDGADTLRGGAGADILTGGAGNDIYLFGAGDGHDAILGFTLGGSEDSIQVTGYSSYVLAHEGAHLRLIFDANNSILLANVEAMNFTAADINIALAYHLFTGTDADDWLPGTDAADLINGQAGADYIRSLAGNDTLNGGDGDDKLDGGLGNDVFNGGAGVDVVDYSNDAAAITVNLSVLTGQNTGVGTDTLSGIENLIGGSFNDNFTGDAGANWLYGGGGNDTLRGGAGNDRLEGYTGNDTFIFAAGDGVDTIIGFVAGGTDDAIQVSGYAAYTLSVEGNDLRVVFDASNSILLKNTFIGSFTAADINIPMVNKVTGTGSAETLTGTAGVDELYGLGGNDTLKGDAGNDILDGGDGDDLLEGGLGDDQLIGGAGTNDKADYRAAASAVTVNLSTLTAQNTGGAGVDTLSGIEQVLGSAFNDTLTGDAFANTLDGKAGNDVLKGASGGDILIGGAGADALDGGGDLDYASYISATVGVGINLTTGVHTGDAMGDTFANIERFRLSGFADTFIGSSITDYVLGAEGNDTLSGGGGVDRLYGQADLDTLNGDGGNDILIGGLSADVLNGGADRDTASYETMTTGVTLNLTTGVHTGDATGDTFNSIEIFWLTAFNDVFTGSAGDDEARGNDGSDTLSGAAGVDTLRGENGADILNGDDGDDFLYGGTGADQLNGGAGIDTASYLLATAGVTINLTTGTHTGEAAGDVFNSVEHYQLSNGFTLADSFTGSAGDDWVAGYKGVDTINGMGGNDTLNGGAHDDVINGGDGNDKLIGESGNDALTGGAGADQFRVTTTLFGNDTITDFENGVDKIRVTGIAAWNDFSDVNISTNGAGWAVITFTDGSSITLTGVIAADVDASDFLWT